MGSTTRIQIVDRDPVLLQVARRVLQSAGYEVTTAATGREALALGERFPPDVLLLDTGLPDMGAEEMCRRITACPELDNTVLLLLSPAGPLPVRQTPCEALHVFARITRPTHAGELPAWVHEVRREVRRAEAERWDQRLRHLNRLHTMLSKVNEAIIRVREPQALFEQVCRIAVEEGGLRMAWIGRVEPEARRVRPVAQWGIDEGYLSTLRISTEDVPEGWGPVGTAVREERPDIRNDFRDDPRSAPWQAQAMRHGFHSVAAFPLRTSGRVVGALCLYARELRFFTEERVRLLDSIADDLSFALDAAEQEQRRRDAERALRESRVRVAEQARALDLAQVLVQDPEGRITFWNTGAERLYGWTREEALGSVAHDLLKTVFPEPLERIRERLAEEGNWNGELTHTRRDGSRVVVASHWVLYRDAEGNPAAVVEANNVITERKRAEEALRESEQRHRELAEQFRNLSAYLQDAREEERIRIAREIHDELGQLLTGIRMDVAWVLRRLSVVAHSEAHQTVLARISSSSALAQRAIESVRRIATELRPGILDDFGLMAAIEWQAGDFAQRTGINCEIVQKMEDVEVPPPVATALFRIFQEALTNVARHSGASMALVRMTCDGEGVELDIWDNGRGITPKEANAGLSLGLLGMRERAHLVGGELEVWGEADWGTRVSARVPIAGGPMPGGDGTEKYAADLSRG